VRSVNSPSLIFLCLSSCNRPREAERIYIKFNNVTLFYKMSTLINID
jgi:hypothetical protein